MTAPGTEAPETLPVRSEEDVVRVRQAVRALVVRLKFSLVDQTKIVTAASELARNTLVHGGGGETRLEIVHDGVRSGLKMTFEDQGPGILDIDRALRDGFTSGGGLGLGLGGSKRLVSELRIETEVGMGSRITALKWK
ncbi:MULTISPECIES: anti-sigma regulatory factor [Bacteria]|uniref:Sigma-B regulator RsbT n=1 Tax=Deinococcus radiodurans (strain ATCC 13939 / DSM 20539 / JCM 16871 / CCUG 27074 / LMG 4051 / NBRC 15346 / NCIMB 9279 / VKM B-1422 / R1) TaxID=243230 RepID=Q9RZT7_DEIRA|nr:MULTISPECIES: anti-sigma regulatory factor [Bacteria]AAF12580.1 sigma-B regulator RsbT [Deinococcus radiodurans R1 = ATCC 13939 = DSM 20539]ANC73202.1 anti-sigma regulatory factor [Deinococcus radiodurans R1 = ATCC 13939 = DSM 20539]QEM73312.1 anti-sigma regulatory factor [Deinococcus radiodurans]UDL02163.1 anti-sigma regulatory factor [Deinococcus radiodurans R1 = ATCC 13939 = DSM 20539]UID71967.1 anti-sigma regulatory factor [Deinococcus radiodurans R1 = ATCC 13939 = DSM 20539]